MAIHEVETKDKRCFPTSGFRKAFTLIELLAVIAIIVLLLSLLLPSLNTARELARRAVCASNLRNQYLGFVLYAGDFNDTLPRGPGNWGGQDYLAHNYTQFLDYLHYANNYLNIATTPVGGQDVRTSGNRNDILACPSIIPKVPTSIDPRTDAEVEYLVGLGNAAYTPNLKLTPWTTGGDRKAMVCDKLSFAPSGGGLWWVYYYQNGHNQAGGKCPDR